MTITINNGGKTTVEVGPAILTYISRKPLQDTHVVTPGQVTLPRSRCKTIAIPICIQMQHASFRAFSICDKKNA